MNDESYVENNDALYENDFSAYTSSDENESKNETKSTTVTQLNTSIGNDLREWALTHNVTHTALNGLLAILKKSGVESLPLDSRVLLNTPRTISVRQMGVGEYWHYGLANSIQKAFGTIHEDQCISLTFNIDGLQPKESSNFQVWPILAKITEIPKMKPLVIGIYAGYEKPQNSNEFLSEFVDELNAVLENGVDLNDHTIAIKIRCFVCDTPARAMIKGN